MASIIKADNIQKVSDGTNIIKKCGSTITLGSCGATISLAAGATQTGFGRTGTVDWCTTAKTAPFTGVSGKGYFVNTTCGAVTVTLPATPTAGDIISVADYASTWNTNNVTLCRNSSKINGQCQNATLKTVGQSITLVYVDATRGWKNTMDSTSNVSGGPGYIVATGGTITCCGNYKIHTFTGDGCFTITTAANCSADNKVDYLVVAGGGSGGQYFSSGGGGAGGYRESHTVPISGCYTASPLASATSLPVTATTYPVTVGAGGTAPLGTPPSAGSPSTFSSITSTGGGNGVRYHLPGVAGGSGSGGGGQHPSTPQPGGAGNTPPVSPPQGNTGGSGGVGAPGFGGGAGGGAGATGPNYSGTTGGTGAVGVSTSITGSAVSYAGGGGGGTESGTNGGASPCGTGGAAGPGPSTAAGNGSNGTANRGGGGGGATRGSTSSGDYGGGSGGSGIVVIRYRYQ